MDFAINHADDMEFFALGVADAERFGIMGFRVAHVQWIEYSWGFDTATDPHLIFH